MHSSIGFSHARKFHCHSNPLNWSIVYHQVQPLTQKQLGRYLKAQSLLCLYRLSWQHFDFS